jgi:hypothetical protein
MPDCYLLAVAEGSSLDQHSNNLSLFSLVEILRLRPPPNAPPIAPFEIHSYWQLSPDEIGVTFEWRLVFVAPDNEVPWEKVFEFRSPTVRHRFRVFGFPVLVSGQIRLQVDWRESGTQQWQRCDVFWPIEIEVQSIEESLGEAV